MPGPGCRVTRCAPGLRRPARPRQGRPASTRRGRLSRDADSGQRRIDEHEIERLIGASAPIDGFGIGSSLAVSTDAPVLDTVYKLVAFDGRPVRKTSEGKVTWPDRKQVWRGDELDVLALADEAGPPGADLPPASVTVRREIP